MMRSTVVKTYMLMVLFFLIVLCFLCVCFYIDHCCVPFDRSDARISSCGTEKVEHGS